MTERQNTAQLQKACAMCLVCSQTNRSRVTTTDFPFPPAREVRVSVKAGN